MDILSAIHKRRSDRTYLKKPVPDELLAKLLHKFELAKRINDLPLRLVPKPGKEVEHCMTGLIGSYGSIQGAPIWVVGISKEGKDDQVNFGFAMEQFVLECTRAGLGTCWVGGFFKKSALEDAVSLKPDERIICISPVGFAAPRRLMEKSMRTLGGLNRRKPMTERVFYQKWGRPATSYLESLPEWMEVFEAARWAPSAANKQPCHYVIHEDRILISVLTSLQKKYPGFIANDRAEDLNFQGVDAGIAMAHVYLAAKQMGLPGKWNLSFDEAKERKSASVPSQAKLIGIFNYKDNS